MVFHHVAHRRPQKQTITVDRQKSGTDPKPRLYPSSMVRCRGLFNPLFDESRIITIASIVTIQTSVLLLFILSSSILMIEGLHTSSSKQHYYRKFHCNVVRSNHNDRYRPVPFSYSSSKFIFSISSTSITSPSTNTTHNEYQDDNDSKLEQITKAVTSSTLTLSKSIIPETQFIDPSSSSSSSSSIPKPVSTIPHKKSSSRKSRRPRRRQRSVVSKNSKDSAQKVSDPSTVTYTNHKNKDTDEISSDPLCISLLPPILDVSSFLMDLQTLAREDPNRAHIELHRMYEYGDAISPVDSVMCYMTVMEGYIQVGQLQNAQNVLDELEKQVQDKTATTSLFSSLLVLPTATVDQMYITMAQAWVDDYKDDYSGTSVEHAERILRRVMSSLPRGDVQETSTASFRRDTFRTNGATGSNTYLKTTAATIRVSKNAIVKIWTIVVDGWSKRSGIVHRAMIRADELLHEMETHIEPFIRPNVLTYTSVICGLSRCKQNDMARRAEDILDRMKQNHVLPDMVAYAAVINCWAKAVSGRERGIAAKRAISLLNEMERLYITKKVYSVKPSTLTYITVITAIGNCIDPDAAELAEGILQRMRNLHESGTIVNVKPNTATYNAVLFSLGQSPVTKRNPTALRAEKLFDDMIHRVELGERDVQPDVRSWAFVLRAWARSKQPDAAEQAQRILDKMEHLYDQGFSPVRPNFVCYTTVMGAWGYSRSSDALNNMERILKRMEDKYTETLEPDVRPNTVSYVTCIDAFVGRNEPDAAQRAQAIVDRMMQLYSKGLGHVRPTRPVFDVLIQAWSRSKEKNAAQNAEKIFHWMENQYNQAGDTLVRPNEISLCAVLNAWANQAENGGAARALQIWEHTNSVATKGDHGFRSTIAMANIVIKAIARSKDPDVVTKAERVLLKLEDDYQSGKSYVRPDVTTYSSVINACAYCVGNAARRTEALRTALRTFYKLYDMKDENANNITYGTMLKAIQNLMPISEERIELVRKVFDMCCEDGCVDYFVLSQVRFASPQLYRDLVEGPCGLGGPGLKYGLDAVLKNVPTEWTANTLD